jgi:hypothetical protein
MREKRTSSLATGREEPPLSLFNYGRDTFRESVSSTEAAKDVVARVGRIDEWR